MPVGSFKFLNHCLTLKDSARAARVIGNECDAPTVFDPQQAGLARQIGKG